MKPTIFREYDIRGITDKHRGHEWTTVYQGGQIIFYCPKCQYYERLGWRTGETEVKNSKPSIRQPGEYSSDEYRDKFDNLNRIEWKLNGFLDLMVRVSFKLVLTVGTLYSLYLLLKFII